MSNSPSSLERLLADLKRRKVFRVMAVYGATAFVLLQVADQEAVRIGRGLDDVGSVASQLDNAATFYAMFDRPDDALDLLEETVGQNGGFNSLAYLTQSPDYLTLRGNPRFEAVVERRRAFEEQAALDSEADRPWLP